MEVAVLHIMLGILLFFTINWIGKHSYSIGYMEISIFVKQEEAPALNFLIRVLTPIVYLIVVSTILYSFCLDKFVENIYLVNIYYISFRLFFNLITNRGLLLNWGKQFLYWGAIAIVSYFVYIKVIINKVNILPDFTTIANELWIIILIFIFQLFNNIRLSQEGTIKRKNGYLKSRYNHFKKLYGTLITSICQNEAIESICYAIIIYEDFNRPKVARFIEYIKFYITKKPHTLGVMQVYTATYISDRESIRLGTQKVVDAYSKYLNKIEKREVSYPYEWAAIDFIIEHYNTGSSYSNEVSSLSDTIKDLFYIDTKDKLIDEDDNKINN